MDSGCPMQSRVKTGCAVAHCGLAQRFGEVVEEPRATAGATRTQEYPKASLHFETERLIRIPKWQLQPDEGGFKVPASTQRV